METRVLRHFVSLFARVLLVVVLVGAGAWSTVNAAPALQVIPTISILSVVPDTSVTVRTANYPANDTFNVYMGLFGTRGVGGTLVDTFNSGAGGSFDRTFTIPAGLKTQRLIAIRLESPTTGYFSYNWFYNNTTTTGPIPPTGGLIPTFSIASVVTDTSVTISTLSFPANDNFTVTMGLMGTRGVGGTVIETVNSGAGGTFSKTFTIPAGLKGQSQIAIRLESPTSGYYAYNWFYNNTSGGPIPPTGGTLPPGVFPTFTITGVVRDTTVTVLTANLPANDTFDVYMNTYGTQGAGGTLVQSIPTGAGGAQTFTFTLPAGVKGLDRIAIRMQSPSSGYFAYNWFWNNNHP